MSLRSWLGACLGIALGAVAAGAQQRARFAGSVSLVEHRVDLGGGDGVQRAFGPVGGVHVAFAAAPWLELGARARAGHLRAKTPFAEARDVAELGVSASVLAGPSLAFTAGFQGRSFSGTLGTQRWTGLSVGMEDRVTFIGGAIRGVFQAAVFPLVSVSGHRSPNVALVVGSGLEWTGRRFSGSALYTLERYDFPREGSDRRREQLAALTVRVGVRLGRPR